MSGVFINSSQAIYASTSELQDAISQIQQVGAIAPFIQSTNALASWNTNQTGVGSDHNLLNNNTVLLDPITGDMSNMNSLSFTNNNSIPPVTGSVWLNDTNNHLYHGLVDLEATGGNVTGPLVTQTGEISLFADIAGNIITNSNVIIDPSKNVGNYNSLTFDPNSTIPVSGSLWLNSMDNHLYHNNVDLETVGTGDVIGPPSAIPGEISLFNSTDGKLLKESSVFLDSSKNIVSLKSITFDSSLMIPNPGSLWLNNGDNHLYHGSVDLEQVGSGNVIGPISSTPRTVPIFTDNTGDVIGNSGILIDNSNNAGSFKSLTFNSSSSIPVTGSLWLNSSDNHLYHGSQNIDGNVQGPNISTDSALAIYDGIDGSAIKNTNITIDDADNISNISSLLLTQHFGQPIADGIWLNIVDDHVYHNSNDLEKQGDIVGPSSAINNNLAAFNLTTGKLIKDSGISSLTVGNLVGPSSAINNDVALFDTTSGKLLKDSGINVLALGDVKGPSSSISDNISSYNGITGKLIKDSGVGVNTLVIGPATTVINNNLVSFDTTTGKLIKDSGILSSNIVQGPASSTNGELTIYSGTTGKLVTNSGIIASSVGNVFGPSSSISDNVSSYNGTTGKLIKDSGIGVNTLVIGPSTPVINNNLVAFDTTTGKLIKDSGISSIGSTSGVSVITDVKPANTNGGTFNSGSWITRNLNTIVTNGLSGVTLASNQITLVAGNYRITGYAPARNVQSHQTRIQNITDATTVVVGESQFTQDATGLLGIGGGIAVSNSQFDGILTISSTKVFELQHQCSSSQPTNGLGVATNFGVNCIYSKVVITKFY